MDLQSILKQIDAPTAEAFVRAARSIIDALLIEAQRVREISAPEPCDYNTATLPRATPPGGWLSADELRRTTQQLTEAMVAEKWVDGLLFAVKALAILGGAA
jgi:hypothetical protein